jgi:hypothetical protein
MGASRFGRLAVPQPSSSKLEAGSSKLELERAGQSDDRLEMKMSSHAKKAQ